MANTSMTLEILLPHRVLTKVAGVSRIVAEGREGSFGLLPHRLDCVAALAPGVLVYETEAAKETFVAVDVGVLVKTGLEVLVSVRRALTGSDLHALRDSVEREFLALSEREREGRAALAKLEVGLLRRLAELRHE